MEIELSSSFETDGGLVSGSSEQRLTITGELASTTVDSVSSSMTTSSCYTHTVKCNKNYLWGWQFTFTYGSKTMKLLGGDKELICTDHPSPCCLPGTFSDPVDPSNCDVRRVPGVCGHGKFEKGFHSYQPGYTQLSSNCLNGPQLGDWKVNTSLPMCRKQCNEHPNCTGFDYQWFNRKCTLKETACEGWPGTEGGYRKDIVNATAVTTGKSSTVRVSKTR